MPLVDFFGHFQCSNDCLVIGYLMGTEILSSSGPGPGPRSGSGQVPGQVPGQVQKVQGLRAKDLDLG